MIANSGSEILHGIFLHNGSKVDLAFHPNYLEHSTLVFSSIFLSTLQLLQKKIHETIPINNFLRLEYLFFPESDDVSGFTLTSLDTSISRTYYFTNTLTLRDWKSKLSSAIVQPNFHEHYEALERLGKGRFANVFLVKHRKTGMFFAAKAYSKRFLQSNSQGLVHIIQYFNF